MNRPAPPHTLEPDMRSLMNKSFVVVTAIVRLSISLSCCNICCPLSIISIFRSRSHFRFLFLFAFRQSEPYGMLKETAEKQEGNAQFEGFGIELIDELSKKLGFSYTFYLQPDNKYGGLDAKTGEWNGMLREIIDNVSKCPSQVVSSRFISSRLGNSYKSNRTHPAAICINDLIFIPCVERIAHHEHHH